MCMCIYIYIYVYMYIRIYVCMFICQGVSFSQVGVGAYFETLTNGDIRVRGLVRI